MEPLCVFIAKVRLWHAVAASIFSLLFVVAITDTASITPAVSLQQWIHSLAFIPLMAFTLAFWHFAYTTRKFAASTMFPSIFLVCTALAAFGIVDFALQEPNPPVILLLFMGLISSLMMSSMMWAMIAIRQRGRGR